MEDIKDQLKNAYINLETLKVAEIKYVTREDGINCITMNTIVSISEYPSNADSMIIGGEIGYDRESKKRIVIGHNKIFKYVFPFTFCKSNPIVNTIF